MLEEHLRQPAASKATHVESAMSKGPSNQKLGHFVNTLLVVNQTQHDVHTNNSASHIASEHSSFRLDSAISIIRHNSAQVHDDPGKSMDQVEIRNETSISNDKGFQKSASGGDVAMTSSIAGRSNKFSYRSSMTLLGKNMVYWLLMLASSIALVLGLSAATLLGRLYFVDGGSRRWLYTWIECTGWPILLPPLAFGYFRYNVKPSRVTPMLLAVFVVMGCLTALTNLLYSWGLSYLPVSTNSLLCSSQLVFNAVFSYALVGHKITPYVVNSIVTITLGTVLLAVTSGSDRPAGTTEKQYAVGIVVTIVASALFALTLPLIELIYRNIVGKTSFVRVMEVQLGIEMVASLFSLVGMWVAGDFEAMKEEALLFEAGSTAYINTLLWSAVGWQLYLLGGVGIIFLASSLLSCSFMTAMIPVLPLLAVVFFHDTFSAVKGIAMLLSLWGFLSYLYGGYLDHLSNSVSVTATNNSTMISSRTSSSTSLESSTILP